MTHCLIEQYYTSVACAAQPRVRSSLYGIREVATGDPVLVFNAKMLVPEPPFFINQSQSGIGKICIFPEFPIKTLVHYYVGRFRRLIIFKKSLLYCF